MKNIIYTTAGVILAASLSGCFGQSSHSPTVQATSPCCGHQPMMAHPVATMPMQQAQPMLVPVAQQQMQPQPMMMPQQPVYEPKPQKRDLMKISAVGYGAESTFSSYTPGQRRLMAIRSSKLDAYRALAEQIYGIKIDSNTSVATLTAKNDSFRARVNAMVKGARIVSVTPMADNNYETVLEVFVDKAFFEKAFVYTGDDGQGASTESLYNIRNFQ